MSNPNDPKDPRVGVTDEQLSAWLDGELAPPEQARVEAWLREHPEDAARARLSIHLVPLGELDRDVAGGDATPATERRILVVHEEDAHAAERLLPEASLVHSPAGGEPQRRVAHQSPPRRDRDGGASEHA